MGMRHRHRLGIVLTLSVCSACVSLNLSSKDVAGRWQVECEGGKETLDLNPDGHYVYTVESPRRRVRAEGDWMIKPPRSKTDGTHIVLRNAPQSCDAVEFFKGLPDNTLDPVVEGAVLAAENRECGVGC